MAISSPVVIKETLPEPPVETVVETVSPVTSNGTDSTPVPVANNEVTEPGSFKSMEELEKEHILASLQYTKGNRTQAASLLKISIRTLRNKLNDYKLDGVEF